MWHLRVCRAHSRQENTMFGWKKKTAMEKMHINCQILTTSVAIIIVWSEDGAKGSMLAICDISVSACRAELFIVGHGCTCCSVLCCVAPCAVTLQVVAY